MAKKGKHPGGRPAEYNPKHHVPWARMLARQGMTIDEIADEMGVNRRTVFRWKDRYPEFCHAINEGRESTDSEVENALLRRALGGKATKTRKVMKKDVKNGVEYTHSEVVETECEVLPDTAACIFWLKNRQPDKWRDKREYEHTLLDEVMPDELSAELERLAEEL